MLNNHHPRQQCPRHQRHQHHRRRRQRQQLTHQLTTINQPSTNLIYANAHTTLANNTASGTIIHSGTHTTLTTKITTTPQRVTARGERNGREKDVLELCPRYFDVVLQVL